MKTLSYCIEKEVERLAEKLKNDRNYTYNVSKIALDCGINKTTLWRQIYGLARLNMITVKKLEQNGHIFPMREFMKKDKGQ